VIEKLQPIRWTCRDCGAVVNTIDNQALPGWKVIRCGAKDTNELLGSSTSAWDIVCPECVTCL